MNYLLTEKQQGRKSKMIKELNRKDEYVLFDPADYVDNPVALARIKAELTQEELAKKLKVSQAYVSKLENQDEVSVKVLQKVMNALAKRK
jgi:ribosome-binding protein aMBF1 (putative translation factor)